MTRIEDVAAKIKRVVRQDTKDRLLRPVAGMTREGEDKAGVPETGI